MHAVFTFSYVRSSGSILISCFTINQFNLWRKMCVLAPLNCLIQRFLNVCTHAELLVLKTVTLPLVLC